MSLVEFYVTLDEYAVTAGLTVDVLTKIVEQQPGWQTQGIGFCDGVNYSVTWLDKITP